MTEIKKIPQMISEKSFVAALLRSAERLKIALHKSASPFFLTLFFSSNLSVVANEKEDISTSPIAPSPAQPSLISSPIPIPPAPLDLQTCFELAILQSETLGMKDEDIRVAQARYWQAIGSVFPKIHLITTESVQNTAGGSSGFNSSSGTQNGSGFSNSKDHFLTRLNVRQPIFSGFRDRAIAAANQAVTEARKFDKRRSLQLLYLDVGDVFYQILMYQEDLRLLDQTRISLEERNSELQKRVKLGKSRTGEVLMSKSELADTLVTIEHIKGLLGASIELFNFLTGLSSPEPKLKDLQILPTAEALEFYLSKTGERPDILAAIQTEKSAKKNLTAAKGEHWPIISAEGDYYLKEHPESRRDWNIFLTCDIPLFEGGVIEARVREQKALVRSSELNLAQLRRSINKDVRIAYNDFITSAAQVARLREEQAAAKENYHVQNEDYKRGITSNLEVLQALTQMHDVGRRLIDMEMTARANLVHLHVAAGATP